MQADSQRPMLTSNGGRSILLHDRTSYVADLPRSQSWHELGARDWGRHELHDTRGSKRSLNMEGEDLGE